jgi:hypothetical protein
MNIWIELATVIVEMSLVWYFFTGILGKSVNKTAIKLCTGIAYSIALALLSLFVNSSPLRSTLIIVCTYFAAKIYFDRGWIATIYPTVLFFLFAILSDIICGMLLQFSGFSSDELMGAGIDRLLYNILGKLVHLLCLYIVLTITRPQFDVNSLAKSLPLLSCQILSIYICQKNFMLVMSENGPDFLRIETLGILYINLIICAFVEVLNRTHEREREAENARQQLELQRNYYDDVMEWQEETRSLWHDIKKYMAAMESLVGKENKEEAQQCLNSIQSAFPDLKNAVDTGNALIDSILTYGIKRATEVGVVIKPEIWVDSQLDFPAVDLFVIIGNTLDNAIEACCQVEEISNRIISINLRQKNHLLFYEISNPYNINALPKPGKIHGYGLKNVHTCVDRNNGVMSVSDKDEVFTVSVQLNLA